VPKLDRALVAGFPGRGEPAAPQGAVALVLCDPGNAAGLAVGAENAASFRHLQGAAPEPERFDGHDLGPLLRVEGQSVRDAVLFTYDDHQAGTALQEAAGQPNPIRCVRDARWKYAVYLDPARRVAPEYEMYDLESDPNETRNLLDKHSGRTRSASHELERRRLAMRLTELCIDSGTLTPTLPTCA
jgi:hypothetical protein